MGKNTGQVVILLLLIMVVALAIGLSTIGRSILEVSTSRKSEDSSRAFSAAEAGIEKAIKDNENNLGGATGTVSVPITGQTIASADAYGLPIGTNALGYSSRTKSDFAQFWLANPDTLTQGYTGNSFVLYFGNPDTKKYFPPNGIIDDQPGIEVNIVYWDGRVGNNKYIVIKRYYDSKRATLNGLTASRDTSFGTCDSSYPALTPTPIPVNNGTDNYYCKVTVDFSSIILGDPTLPNDSTTFPVMARIRLLYTNIDHPVALMPTATGFPKQANLYSASGTSGDVKRKLEVAVYRAVMPQYFDYAVFSAATFLKQQ